MGALKEICCSVSEVELAEFGGNKRRGLQHKQEGKEPYTLAWGMLVDRNPPPENFQPGDPEKEWQLIGNPPKG